jgi:hypothetical protein
MPKQWQFSSEVFSMDEYFTDSYRKFLRSMCSYWAPGQDEFLAGEIVQQWSVRQSFRREMSGIQAEILKREAVLGDLLYRKKEELCKQGRNGRWCAWLRQQKIPRSTADRLVLQHAEFFDLTDELTHRESAEASDGNISQAAYRTSDRLENLLRTPHSRMKFVRCLGDLLGLDVQYRDGDSAHFAIRPVVNEADSKDVAPNIIQITDDGKVVPTNFELREGEEDSVL